MDAGARLYSLHGTSDLLR